MNIQKSVFVWVFVYSAFDMHVKVKLLDHMVIKKLKIWYKN